MMTDPRPLYRRMPAALLLVLAAWLAAGAAHAEDEGTVEIGGLIWAAASNGEDVPWAEADAYCRTLELAGHSDWRLPTLDEVRMLHDPQAEGEISSSIELPGCCLWSSTTLEEREPDVGGQGGAPSNYAWGFLFDGGIEYYSVMFFPDGQALCAREPD